MKKPIRDLLSLLIVILLVTTSLSACGFFGGTPEDTTTTSGGTGSSTTSGGTGSSTTPGGTGSSTTPGGTGYSSVYISYPDDAVVLTKSTSRVDPIGNEIVNNSRFYMHLRIHVSNSTSSAETVSVRITIADEYEEIKADNARGEVTLRKSVKNVGGVGRSYEYTGEFPVSAGMTDDKDIVIPLRVYNEANREYESKVEITCENSIASVPATYTQYILNKPHTLIKLGTPRVTLNNGVLSWAGVANAPKYGYKIDESPIENINQTQLSLDDLSVGSHIISVCAVGDNVEYSDSPYSKITIEKLPCAAPKVVEGKILSWSSVKDCTAYEIIDRNGQVLKRVDGATEIGLADLQLKEGTTELYVRPVTEGKSGYVVTLGDSPVVVKCLAKPVVSISNAGKLTWNAVAGAAHYDIYRNGVFFRTVTDTKCSLLGEGGEDYYGDTFYVIAGSTDANTVDSGASNTVTSRVN